MSGIDGGVKLNNLPAPSKKTETENSVSDFDLPTKEVVVEQPIEEVVVEQPIEEVKVKIPAKKSKFNVKAEFDKVVAIVKTAYDKVFSKTPNFKPEFDETVGDLILYLSSKLKNINANAEFDNAFNLSNYALPTKYTNGYIPLALKLAVWCENKKLLQISEDLLYEISSVYKKSADSVGVKLLEFDVASAFDSETELVFNK